MGKRGPTTNQQEKEKNLVNVSVKLDPALHADFKAVCAKKKAKMRLVVAELIENYVAKFHFSRPASIR